MQISGSNLIGKSESSKSGDTFNAYNPRTMQALKGDFVNATGEEVNQALDCAVDAFKSYKNESGKNKAAFLKAIAENIIDLGEDLIIRAMHETGLPEARLVGERGRTVNQLKMFAGLLEEGSWVDARIDTALPDREPVAKPDIRRMLVPLGPVVVFGASNFPLAFSTAGGDTASALAAGNPVIVKGHESHPGTNEMVSRAIQKAAKSCGLAEGVFSSLNGNSPAVGQMLVKHPKTKAVGFTGSFRAGKAIFDTAAQRDEPIPVFAEMGSINPIFIMPEEIKGNNENLAKSIAGSVNLGAGQFCTNPGLLIAKKSDHLNTFIHTLAKEIEALQPAVMLNESIHVNYEKGMNEVLDQPGVNLQGVYKNELSDRLAGRPAVATVNAQEFFNNPRLHQEVFGPFTLLVICDSDEQFLHVAEKLEGQLTVSVMGTENELVEYNELINILREKTGRILFNGVPTGVEVCPSMQHGGPFPATTDSRTTSVGTAAVLRFVRPVAFQNWPQNLLPSELRDKNPLKIWRLVNGTLSKEEIK